jgi:hypothetical protein
MKTLNHSKAHIISQPTLFSSAVPTQSCTEPLRGSIKRILMAAGLATAVAAPAWATQLPDVADSSNTGVASVLAGQDADGAVDPESVAKANWRTFMRQNSTPSKGCFHASYPNIFWEMVECKTGQPRAHPVYVKPTDPEAEVTGNGNDYVAKAKGLITMAIGTFHIKGVTSEKSVGVAAFDDDGTLGSNEYTVQINTNGGSTTKACASPWYGEPGGSSGCHVWQQFVYATDYISSGEAAVFMQYWLLDWGDSGCPSGWNSSGKNCWMNSSLTSAPDVPPKDLGKVELTAAVSAGGDDSVNFAYDGEIYYTDEWDSFLDISSVWNKAEFNVVGDGGGSRAVFNKGSSITGRLELVDGSYSAPTCVANGGTTGETNNLNLGKCATYSAVFGGIDGRPGIQFTESN